MNVNELLDAIEITIEESTSFPMVPTKRLVDFDRVQAYIEEIRLVLPEELHQAKVIVNDRSHILQQANDQADMIVRKAEVRAKAMVSEQEIVKGAQKRAAEMLNSARAEERAIRQTTTEFCERMLRSSEKVMLENAAKLKEVSTNLRQNAKGTVNK
ncbi:MAG: ATPase [Faecalibacterium sp.]